MTGELTTPDDSGAVSEALVAKFTGPDGKVQRSEDGGKTWRAFVTP